MNISVPSNDGALVLTGSHWGMFRARGSNGRITEIQREVEEWQKSYAKAPGAPNPNEGPPGCIQQNCLMCLRSLFERGRISA
jgi:hypothetical protein